MVEQGYGADEKIGKVGTKVKGRYIPVGDLRINSRGVYKIKLKLSRIPDIADDYGNVWFVCNPRAKIRDCFNGVKRKKKEESNEIVYDSSRRVG